MIEYEIKSRNRVMICDEYIKASNILDAISKFYSSFGYIEILQIKIATIK